MKQPMAKKLLYAVAAGAAVAAVLLLYLLFRGGEERRMPFSAAGAVGLPGSEAVSRLQLAGFSDVTIIEDPSGWLDGGRVLWVAVNGQREFEKGAAFAPETRISVVVASGDRLNAAAALAGWKTDSCQEVAAALAKAGFTHVTVTDRDTLDPTRSGRVAFLTVNRQDYTGGECFVPRDAPIALTRWRLMVEIGSTSSEFASQDRLIVAETLRRAGFTDVRLEEVTDGWGRGNRVLQVLADGTEAYRATDLFLPETPITVRYSSDDRTDITQYLYNWHEQDGELLAAQLRERGFARVTVTRQPTALPSQHGLIAAVTFDGLRYTGGDCCVQAQTAIEITCHQLMLRPGRDRNSFLKKDYHNVVSDLRALGFTNLRLERADDLVLGWFAREGTVSAITIGGAAPTADGLYPCDAPVVITVHTFPGRGCEDIPG